MIKSAGNRISPQEIEDAAIATGLAAEAVAFGVPDTRLGQAIHLVVRSQGDGKGNSEAALETAICRISCSPAVIRRVAAMPINPNGKIDRALLAREAA